MQYLYPLKCDFSNCYFKRLIKHPPRQHHIVFYLHITLLIAFQMLFMPSILSISSLSFPHLPPLYFICTSLSLTSPALLLLFHNIPLFLSCLSCVPSFFSSFLIPISLGPPLPAPTPHLYLKSVSYFPVPLLPSPLLTPFYSRTLHYMS